MRFHEFQDFKSARTRVTVDLDQITAVWPMPIDGSCKNAKIAAGGVTYHVRDSAEDIRALITSQAAATPAPLQSETIESYFARQIEWSRNTFGPGQRTGGIIDHISKELKEVAAAPDDLSEWVDLIILSMDGFWRHGGTAEDLLPRLLQKQAKNMARTWPDWRTMSADKAIEHDRSGESA